MLNCVKHTRNYPPSKRSQKLCSANMTSWSWFANWFSNMKGGTLDKNLLRLTRRKELHRLSSNFRPISMSQDDFRMKY